MSMEFTLGKLVGASEDEEEGSIAMLIAGRENSGDFVEFQSVFVIFLLQ